MSAAVDNGSPTYPQNASHLDPARLTSAGATIGASNSSSNNFRIAKSLSSSSLALTPKTHNKRTRRRMDPSSGDSKSTGVSCGDSFDCNSLRRSLKRVRLTNQSSCMSPPSKSSTSPSSLLCASTSKSPGEIRLQKDIQHAVLMQNWRPILPRLQLKQRIELDEHDDEIKVGKMFAEPNRSLLTPTSLNFNRASETLFFGDDESDEDDDDDAWKLPSYCYCVESDLLEPQQPKFQTSPGLDRNSDGNASVDSKNRQISVKVFRKSYDPMHIILQVTITDSIRGKHESPNSVVILLQLHFPRLYPHQPPIVRRTDSFTMDSCCGDDDHNLIMRAFLAKSSSLQMPQTWGATSSAPTIWIASSPSECSGYINNVNAVGGMSDNSKMIVLTTWTPVSRLNDIIEMLIQAVCRHFCHISVVNSIVDNHTCKSRVEVKEMRINGSSSTQLKQVCAVESRADEKGPSKLDNIDRSSFGHCFRNDDASSAATNLTPTMSNTTRRKSNNVPHRLQSLQSPQLDEDWKLSHSDEETNSGSDQPFLQFPTHSFANNMRYRSPGKASNPSDDEFDDDDNINQDLNDEDDDLGDAIEYNSMSVQYNRSYSGSSYSSSSVSCNNGTDRIVDVIFPVNQAFPPGRFNQGYNNTNDYDFYRNLSSNDIENNNSLNWYSNASPPRYCSSHYGRNDTTKENDTVMMSDEMMSPTCLKHEVDTSMMDC